MSRWVWVEAASSGRARELSLSRADGRELRPEPCLGGPVAGYRLGCVPKAENLSDYPDVEVCDLKAVPEYAVVQL